MGSIPVMVRALGASERQTGADFTDLRFWEVSPLPVCKADLIAAGMTPGKPISDILLDLRNRLEDRDYSPSEDELLRYALRRTGDNLWKNDRENHESLVHRSPCGPAAGGSCPNQASAA